MEQTTAMAETGQITGTLELSIDGKVISTNGDFATQSPEACSKTAATVLAMLRDARTVESQMITSPFRRLVIVLNKEALIITIKSTDTVLVTRRRS